MSPATDFTSRPDHLATWSDHIMTAPDPLEPANAFQLQLPHGVFGRIASVLTGLFFSTCGTWVLYSLISNRQGLAKFVWYELSLVATVFGGVLFLWGLAAPKWLETVMERLSMHFLWVVAVIFLPFALKAIVFLAREIF